MLTLSGGSGAKRSPFLVQAVHGPVWSAAPADVNWGGDSMNESGLCTALSVLFCEGTLTLPAAQAAAPTAVTPTSSMTSIVGGTAEEQTLLHTIVDRMQPTSTKRIEIVAGGKDVALRMTAPDTSARTLWEQSLVASAFRDRAKAAGDDLTVLLFDGVSNGAALPPGPATPLPSAKPGDAAAARQRFENAAATIGVAFDELTIYQPDGIAVAATLMSTDPASFLLHQMPTFLDALGDRWSDYDGTYIRLVDTSGEVVWETSTSGRIASGSVGSREDLAGCGPVANWGPTPPPCPAK